ncbi:hypothetical protein YC2023_025401 [Brassica napus]
MGTKGDYAASVIERENPEVTAAVIVVQTPVPFEYNIRCNRVWVWVDKKVDGTVVVVPIVEISCCRKVVQLLSEADTVA